MKIKIVLLFVVTLFVASVISIAQTACLTYDVKRNIVRDNVAVTTLNYSAYLFSNGNTSAFFMTPRFDAIQQQGFVLVPGSEGKTEVFSTAPKQSIKLLNLDTLTLKYRQDLIGDMGKNFWAKIELPLYEWTISDESKTDQGVLLQKATLHNLNNQLLCEVWFAPEISYQFAPNGFFNLPGMVFEMNLISVNTVYKLTGYQLDCEIPLESFSPVEFKEPFEFRGTFRKQK